MVAMAATGLSQTWTRVATNGPPNAGLPLLLTDGRVLVHSISSRDWWTLTPKNGNYINGTWKQVASLPSNYAPLYYASAVLRDGRVVIIGGEYNFGASAWTNLGAWYDPVADKWTALSAPSGWGNIGDVQCVVWPDGRFTIASLDTRMATLDPGTMSWSATSATGKLGVFNEEGWTLMPDGTLFTVDCVAAPACERYLPAQGKWVPQASTPQVLVDAGSEEMGPQILLPTGKVLALGATGHCAVFTPGANATDLGSWTATPDLPVMGGGQLELADAPAVLLPNGKVLFGASPGVFAGGTFFFEWDGTAFNQVPATPNSPGNSCFQGNFLMLPTGQAMYTDFSSDVEIYTPTGTANAAWKPTVTQVPSTLVIGKSFTVKGTQFNGLSQCSNYGDDNSNATNYPLVRIKYKNSGRITFFKTHDHSTMAVATGTKIVSTVGDVPINAEVGPATLEVVTNGIASDPVNVTVAKDAMKPDGVGMYEGSSSSGALSSILASDNSYFTVTSINMPGYGQVASAYATFTPGAGTTLLQYSIETNVSSPCQLLFFAYNWNTGVYDSIGNASQTTADKATDFTITNAAKYVSSQGKSKILLRAVNPARSNRLPPITQLKIDQVSLTPG